MLAHATASVAKSKPLPLWDLLAMPNPRGSSPHGTGEIQERNTRGLPAFYPLGLHDSVLVREDCTFGLGRLRLAYCYGLL